MQSEIKKSLIMRLFYLGLQYFSNQIFYDEKQNSFQDIFL